MVDDDDWWWLINWWWWWWLMMMIDDDWLIDDDDDGGGDSGNIYLITYVWEIWTFLLYSIHILSHHIDRTSLTTAKRSHLHSVSWQVRRTIRKIWSRKSMPCVSISSMDEILIRNLLHYIVRSILLYLSRFWTVSLDTSTRVMLWMHGSWYVAFEHEAREYHLCIAL